MVRIRPSLMTAMRSATPNARSRSCETTSELDPLSAVVIAQEIRHLQERIGVTSLVVTHDRDLAFGVADRIAVISEGRILTIGSPDEVKKNPDSLVQQFLHADFKRDRSL